MRDKMLEPLEALPLDTGSSIPPAAAQSTRRPSPLALAALAGLSVGLVLTVVLVVVGATNTPSADPCRLLGAADMGAAVGSSVEPGERRQLIGAEAGVASCGYRTLSRFGDIVVHEQRPGHLGFVARRSRAQGGGGAVPAYRPLAGLGDQAFTIGGGVSVLTDDTFIAVSAQRSRPDFEPIARRLAALAVSKLEPLPDAIVAVTTHFRLVVLSSRDGRVLRTLADRVATARLPAALAVSPDGRTVFFARRRPQHDGCATDVINRVAVAGGEPVPLTPGRFPAVSPDGQWLAFTRDTNCRGGDDQIVVRNLRTRAERSWSSPEVLQVSEPSWAPDSRHLAFRAYTRDLRLGPRLLDTTDATSLDDVPVIRVGSDVWRGYLGGTGYFLGVRAAPQRSDASGSLPTGPSRVVALNSTMLSTERVLFSVAGQIHEAVVSDVTGGHVLAVVSRPDDTVFHLYRWSFGQRAPVRLPASYIAAAWVP